MAMKNLRDYIPEKTSASVEIEDREYVEFKSLKGRTIVINAFNIYVKDDIEKVIISIGDDQYTVTSATAVVSTLKAVKGNLTEYDDASDLKLSVEVVEKKSKKNGKTYFDIA